MMSHAESLTFMQTSSGRLILRCHQQLQHHRPPQRYVTGGLIRVRLPLIHVLQSSSPSCTSDPSPLKGGDFDDYASWVVGQPSTGSFQITSGGPDSTYSRVGVLTRGVVGELNQTIQTCPGVYYAYTFVYNFFNINALHDDIAVISLYADDDHIGNIIAYTSGDTNGYYK